MLLIGILLLFLSITAHELGHAFACRRSGVMMNEICLLGFGPKLFSFFLPLFFGKTPITIRLIPFGGFVSISQISLLRKAYSNPYRIDGYISGAGPVASILFAGILYAISALVSGSATNKELIIIGLLLLIGSFPRYSYHAILPAGFLMLAMLAFASFQNPMKMVQGMGSILTIVDMMRLTSHSIIEICSFVGTISLSIGLINMLPLSVLDGGKLLMSCSSYRHKRVRAVIGISTAIPLLAIIILALYGDIRTVVSWI